MKIARKYLNFSEELAVLFRGDYFLNPDEIGVFHKIEIHCRREILIELVQQGMFRLVGKGKLHNKNTRTGVEKLFE
ncbi:hypothetical protein J7L68_04530 [bacterium]|nr:hypothetical protein [bacterium]